MGEGAHRAGAMPYGGGGSLPPASGRAHIRIHQLYRELARVAAPRLPAIVDEELFVVEDKPVDTPRVAQRLGHPRVQRQRVAAEEVGLVEDDCCRVLAETVHRLVLEP